MQPGTFVRLNYDMWVEDVEGLFDTTDRDRASGSGIYNPEHQYGPIVAVVGAGHLVPGLDKAVQKQEKTGEWTEAELPPEDAFGGRDPKKIETVPMQRFKQSKVQPKVGERIQYKNQPATITRVAGGRVWVDTNSPLAGRKVKYRFRVEETIDDESAKVAALLEHAYRRGVTFDVVIEDKTADVTVPENVKYDRQWPLVKFRVAHELGTHTSLEKVRFIEEYVTKPQLPAEQPETKKETQESSTDDPAESESSGTKGDTSPKGEAEASAQNQ